MGKRGPRMWLSFALVVPVAMVGWVALAPTSLAATGPRFSLRVDAHAVHSGEQVTATGTAPTTCTWLLEWNGERRVGRDRAMFTGTFVAPTVSRPTRIPLQGTCFYNAPVAGSHLGNGGHGTQVTPTTSRSTIMVRVPPSWRHTVMVTVLPPGAAVSAPGGHGHGGGHHGGSLPNSGGPALLMLLAGLAALLFGGAATRASRRLPA